MQGRKEEGKRMISSYMGSKEGGLIEADRIRHWGGWRGSGNGRGWLRVQSDRQMRGVSSGVAVHRRVDMVNLIILGGARGHA
jgi:hypothetical protein